MSRTVTICGNNPTLLETRKLLLEHAGLRAETVLGIELLSTRIQGPLVLCHTLSETEQEEVIGTVRREHPEMPILLVKGSATDRDRDSVSEVSAFAGPEAFIVAAKELA